MFLDIKIYMTVALIFYGLAFAAASRRLIKSHIILAVTGFILDLYATFLMETMRAGSGLTFAIYPPILKFHTTVSIVAILAFLLQMFLGIMRKRTKHIWTAKYLFYPFWVIAYISGIYIIW